MKINKKCCCGAELEITRDSDYLSEELVKESKEWEERHKDCKSINNTPVNIPHVIVDDKVYPECCKYCPNRDKPFCHCTLPNTTTTTATGFTYIKQDDKT